MSPSAKNRRFGDLSTMHGAWASTNSTVTHSRLAEDPAEWRRYHDLYTEARRRWDTVPAYEFARWLNDGRRPCVVADLGCGESTRSRTAQPDMLPAGLRNWSGIYRLVA